jgi:hypothetical protein
MGTETDTVCCLHGGWPNPSPKMFLSVSVKIFSFFAVNFASLPQCVELITDSLFSDISFDSGAMPVSFFFCGRGWLAIDVTKDEVWIGNRIYWTFTARNYK